MIRCSELNDKYVDLDKQKSKLNEALKQATEEVNENYQLKFGEKINLEILDGVEETANLKALKKEFTVEERKCRHEIEKAKTKMMETKQELIKCKKENTNLINKITAQGRRQLDLMKDLESANKEIFVKTLSLEIPHVFD